MVIQIDRTRKGRFHVVVLVSGVDDEGFALEVLDVVVDEGRVAETKLHWFEVFPFHGKSIVTLK